MAADRVSCLEGGRGGFYDEGSGCGRGPCGAVLLLRRFQDGAVSDAFKTPQSLTVSQCTQSALITVSDSVRLLWCDKRGTFEEQLAVGLRGILELPDPTSL